MSREDLKKKLKEKLKKPIDLSKATVPKVSPRYDEIFFEGIAMLDKEDIETDESILEELLKVEKELEQREKLITGPPNGSIRGQLISLVSKGKLAEDELVSKWLELYTTYFFWENKKDLK